MFFPFAIKHGCISLAKLLIRFSFNRIIFSAWAVLCIFSFKLRRALLGMHFQRQKKKMFHSWEENWFFKDKSKKYFVHERKIVVSTIKTKDVSPWIIFGWIENRPFFALLIIQVSHSIKQTFSLSKAIENFLFSPFLSFFYKTNLIHYLSVKTQAIEWDFHDVLIVQFRSFPC